MLKLMLEQFVPLCRRGTHNKFPPHQIKINISHYAPTWLSASKYFSKLLWSQDLLIGKRWWFAKPTASLIRKLATNLAWPTNLSKRLLSEEFPPASVYAKSFIEPSSMSFNFRKQLQALLLMNSFIFLSAALSIADSLFVGKSIKQHTKAASAFHERLKMSIAPCPIYPWKKSFSHFVMWKFTHQEEWWKKFRKLFVPMNG